MAKKVKQITVNLEDEMYNTVKEMAEKNLRSLSDMTRIVLSRLLEEEAKKERSFRDDIIIKEDK